MEWTSLDTWIVAIGALGAAACALLGNFLVLRRMSMMGDAISHAVLPGLAVAFLVTGERTSLPMFIGAGIVGVATAVFTEWIRKLGRVEQSASMGVVFTTLFAVGLVLLVRAADQVDLDPGCVLYGAIEFAPLDRVDVLGMSIPRAALQLGGVLLLDLLFVVLLFKELLITSFDAELSTTIGIRAGLLHYGLMTLVAITTVAAFESVGSILVIAMLIVPPATAHLLTDRLRPMIAVSLVAGVASAALGHVAAISVPRFFGFGDTNTAGMIGVVSGVLFLAALLFAPRHGIISRRLRRSRLASRIAQEDVLGLLYRLEEFGAIRRGESADTPTQPAQPTRPQPAQPTRPQPAQPTRPQPARPAHAILREAIGVGPLMLARALYRLRRRGQIRRESGDWRLTDVGREQARDLIRSHRLWESWLHKHLGVPVERVHRGAEALEHVTDPAMRGRLAEQTDRPRKDPQGRLIP